MTDTVIHSIRVSYDETDERVRNFVSYLKSEKRNNDMLAYYRSAKEIYPEEKFVVLSDNEFSISCDNNHRCVLKLRGM
jgi:hypothetical protein